MGFTQSCFIRKNNEELCDYSVSEFHKATVAELIEHF